MKTGTLMRGGVAACALLAALSAPAFADDFDIGPAKVTLGGFLAMEGIYRSRNETADMGSSYSKIPFSSATNAHVSELRGSARQSRLSVLAQGDVDSNTHVAAYYEMDFLGAAQTANSNQSNSFQPRIRNVYATIDWDNLGLQLLAGQNWSLLTLNSKGITPRNEVPPATIDAQYMVGFNWARQPQIRITKNWDHQFWAAISVENPQTTGISATATASTGVTVTEGSTSASQFNNTNTFSLNHIPDVIGKLAWEPVIGGAQPLHAEVFGLYRSFYDRVSVTAANTLGLPAGIGNRNTTGGGVGGSITWTVIPKTLDLQATAMNGSGIGRYGAGTLNDVTLRPDGSLAPLQETTFLVGATWHATSALDLYAYGGQEAEKSKVFTGGGASVGDPTKTGLAGCMVEGGSCSAQVEAENQVSGGFWWRFYNGKYGNTRFGMQYSYTHLNAFAGAGGVKPTADDSMVFSSIRYYPF